MPAFPPVSVLDLSPIAEGGDIAQSFARSVELAQLAARRGVKIVLITDQWLSPISRVASHMLSAHISVPSNWDSNVAPMALVETLLAAVTDTLYALSASAASDIVRDGPIRAAGRWLSGGIFLGLGLLTAFTGHRAR